MADCSDTETQIGSMIVDRMVCLDCIAAKANVTLLAARDVLLTLARVLHIDAVPESMCDDCRRVKITFRLTSQRPRT